jgi:hypothetical protein
MLLIGMYIEKKLNENWLNCPIIEERSRAIVLFIELMKKIYEVDDKELLKHFIEDSYEKRMQLSKGADSEDFIYYWTNWETDAEEKTKCIRRKSK